MSTKKASKKTGRLVEPESRMRQYELTYIIPSTADVAGVLGEVVSLVKKHKGSIVSQEDWGKRTFTYTIKHGGERHTQGVYTHLVIEMETQAVLEFEHDFRLHAVVMRYLLVLAEDMGTTDVVEVSRQEE